MVTITPSDFTEMVSVGVRLEEAVREGSLTRDEGQRSHCMVSLERNKVKQILLLEKGRLDQLEDINGTSNMLLL